ncbi:5-formyltetrahydrofolate cyclo-ligase [Shewanella sp. Isolate11]|uniref:5-formyltetrahydrofolate cyclo-ligase n=1 Tax=Shewanella sp. Isolate11 TaxID=2908530 RepID=UPI001EFD1028|nr:5-formyltetrahydrofolate cyclo-ligase [Shewanella sp. Isolate11]MCG9697657.1 5-formyltetrahydrofolate cyclo-ligase [Shewanella sp. Isolate11]
MSALPRATAQLSARQILRQTIRQARRSLSQTQQQDFSAQASLQVISLIKQQQAKRVALYLSNDGELDTQPLIEALWQLDIEVYLPRLHPFSPGNLIFLRYQPHTQLQTNTLKIKEPKLDIRQMVLAHELDIVVTPLVAFDAQGNRMGMGGGYYDRTLANWQTIGKPYPLGFAHDCQQVQQLPVEHWDVPLPLIVTPTQIIKNGHKAINNLL